MKKEVLRLVLSPDEKSQLAFIKTCREERLRQYREDYEKEEAKRLDDLENCDDPVPLPDWEL